MSSYADFNVDELHLYAGIDTYVTSRLLKALQPEMIKQESLAEGTPLKSVMKVYEELVTPAFEFILDMELTGILYDVQQNLEFKKQFQEDFGRLEEIFKPQIGSTNVHSDEQLSNLLFKVMNLPVLVRTSKNAPATDGDTLKLLANQTGHAWLNDLAKYKDLTHAYNTFLGTYVEDFVKPDGRIHPTYNLHGTSGFRISGEYPNLTQLPRAKYGYNIRKCYTVPDGYVFLALDYSSAEVKVLANICRDEKLLEALAAGLDPHTFSASKIFKIPYEELAAVLADDSHPLYKEYKNKRQLAKAVTFGILYGSTARGIAEKNNVTQTEAESFIAMYLDEFPGIRKYVSKTHMEAIQNKFVVTPFGRRKRQWGADLLFKGTAAWGASLRNSQNSVIQSTASDIGLMAFSELNKRIKHLGARCICTVYDSIEIECPSDKVAEVLEIAFYVMDDWIVDVLPWMTLPIGVEAELGKNWGECKVVHRGSSQHQLMKVLHDE